MADSAEPNFVSWFCGLCHPPTSPSTGEQHACPGNRGGSHSNAELHCLSSPSKLTRTSVEVESGLADNHCFGVLPSDGCCSACSLQKGQRLSASARSARALFRSTTPAQHASERKKEERSQERLRNRIYPAPPAARPPSSHFHRLSGSSTNDPGVRSPPCESVSHSGSQRSLRQARVHGRDSTTRRRLFEETQRRCGRPRREINRVTGSNPVYPLKIRDLLCMVTLLRRLESGSLACAAVSSAKKRTTRPQRHERGGASADRPRPSFAAPVVNRKHRRPLSFAFHTSQRKIDRWP